MTTPKDEHILAPGHAPTPFTADEIRRGCPPGRTIRLLVESEGHEPLIRTNRFVSCDDEGAVIERARLTTEGEPTGPVETDHATWAELQAHASFPVEHTDVEPERIELPIGTLDCLRYRVRDGSSIQTFWFAVSAPGMPVKYTTEESGRLSTVVTMVADTST